MARGRSRPRKQVTQKRVSSSSSSKGSLNGASLSTVQYTSAGSQAHTGATILENEILSPRSSLVQVQTHSLYTAWAPTINGEASGNRHSSTARVSVPKRSATVSRIIASHPRSSGQEDGQATRASFPQPMAGGLNSDSCRVSVTQKWVPKPTQVDPTSTPIVDEEGFQLVSLGRVPNVTVTDPPTSAVLLNTSNGFQVLAIHTPEIDCDTLETTLGAASYPSNA
ncbi:unnamed protein product [Amaranthus hypochondriacus]